MSMPALPVTVALYLQSISREARTYSVVKSASGCIFTAHELALIPAGSIPTKHAICKLVREAAKRRLGLRLVNQKDPVSMEVLLCSVSLYCRDLGSGVSVLELMFACMALCMFMGFLRFSDMASIYVDGVSFYDDHMEIFLPDRKNDQFRKGDVIFIARGQAREHCPVHVTQLYIRRAGLSGHVPLVQTFDGRRVRGTRFWGVPLLGRPISYPQCRTHFLRMISRGTGWSESEVATVVGTQSCRSGGATRVATDIDFRLFMQHGAWRTASSAHRYILDSDDTRLSVTRAMRY